MSKSAKSVAEKPLCLCPEESRWFAHRLFGLCAKPSAQGLANRPARA